MNRYTVNSLIGEGSFGRVYKAYHKADDRVVAIKIISKRGRSNKELKNLRRECDIQAKIKHPNIIAMLESFETKNDLVVVTEFAYTDLHRYLGRFGALQEERARGLICHLVSALYYLHSNRILHRDLKPQNVLLSEDLHAKLCDFGLARNMTMGTHVLTSIKGTPLYMAPELLAERPYDHLADMWSLGCISYECLAGQPPFCTTSILHLVKLIKYEEVKWPSFLSSDCRSLLQGLLEKDPTMRISWSQILCHPFVEGKLLTACVKSDSSPFINPEKSAKPKEAKKQSPAENNSKDLSKRLEEALQLTDNLSSSRDSINAIAPSDVEQLETDFEEDNDNRIVVPFAECSFKAPNRNRLNFQKLAGEATLPVVNSQTCFVSGNQNLILNHLNDNFPLTTKESVIPASEGVIRIPPQVNLMKSRNKELEKRKLSQNLDNFSLRLAQTLDKDGGQQNRRERVREQDSQSSAPLKTSKNSNQSAEEKRSTENSPPCLLPGWDSCDESQNPPIENDEWLAFLHRTTQEILDGELDSLKQQNLVSIIVAPLRNSRATPKVVESVAMLLALPFALSQSGSCIVGQIKTVYVDVKLVPNLMYASKLLVYQKSTNESSSASMTQTQTRTLRSGGELSSEEIRTLARLYELICHLVHLRQQFLSQFCDAVAILAANDLIINLLNHDPKNAYAVRTAQCIIALFCAVLRELPENAELVEKIIFNSKLQLSNLMQHKSDLMRLRMCMLFRLLARFSLRGLQLIWSSKLKQHFEALAEDSDNKVQEEAENTLGELRQFAFYS